MEKGLVSIISPCYNREKILWRFLNSVLDQTYKKLQVILIDDGSTDNTLGVIEHYAKKFKNAGIQYEFHTKSNGGVSSAINEGLKYVKGEFLCWPDSDDWYEPDAMEVRVNFLNTHREFDIVSCDADFYQDGMNCASGFVSGKAKERFNSRQFWMMLKGKTLVCPICHMVRTEAFWNSHPNRRIFDSRYGQNIQMLLPVYYFYKRGFIDRALCHYLVLPNSLSRSDDSFKKKLSYRNSIEELTVETLKMIPMMEHEREKYIRFVRIKNSRRRLVLAKEYQQKELAHEQMNMLWNLKAISVKDFLNYFKT